MVSQLILEFRAAGITREARARFGLAPRIVVSSVDFRKVQREFLQRGFRLISSRTFGGEPGISAIERRGERVGLRVGPTPTPSPLTRIETVRIPGTTKSRIIREPTIILPSGEAITSRQFRERARGTLLSQIATTQLPQPTFTISGRGVDPEEFFEERAKTQARVQQAFQAQLVEKAPPTQEIIQVSKLPRIKKEKVKKIIEEDIEVQAFSQFLPLALRDPITSRLILRRGVRERIRRIPGVEPPLEFQKGFVTRGLELAETEPFRAVPSFALGVGVTAGLAAITTTAPGLAVPVEAALLGGATIFGVSELEAIKSEPTPRKRGERAFETILDIGGFALGAKATSKLVAEPLIERFTFKRGRQQLIEELGPLEAARTTATFELIRGLETEQTISDKKIRIDKIKRLTGKQRTSLKKFIEQNPETAIFGSVAQEAQIVGVSRQPRDIDVAVKGSSREAAKDIARRFNRAAGERKVEVKGTSVKDIQTGRTLVDVKSLRDLRAGVIGFGLTTEPLTEISGFRVQSLTEQLKRKGVSAIDPAKQFRAFKDVPDFIRIAGTLIESKRVRAEQSIFFRKPRLRAISRLETELSIFREPSRVGERKPITLSERLARRFGLTSTIISDVSELPLTSEISIFPQKPIRRKKKRKKEEPSILEGIVETKLPSSILPISELPSQVSLLPPSRPSRPSRIRPQPPSLLQIVPARLTPPSVLPRPEKAVEPPSVLPPPGPPSKLPVLEIPPSPPLLVTLEGPPERPPSFLDVPSLQLGFKRKDVLFGAVKRERLFTPSLIAVVKGLKTTSLAGLTKTFTGLETRKQIVPRKKKRKRGKK